MSGANHRSVACQYTCIDTLRGSADGRIRADGAAIANDGELRGGNDRACLFALLNEELSASKAQGELYLVGGAVMCLAYGARASTRDVDAAFRPSDIVRRAAARVARRVGLDPTWLNDGVKAFMNAQGNFAPFLELDHLKVMMAEPTYLLAMKCMAMRLGAEFHDEDDVRFLLRLLNVDSTEKALELITKYYPREHIPQKTLYVLPDLLPTLRLH